MVCLQTLPYDELTVVLAAPHMDIDTLLCVSTTCAHVHHACRDRIDKIMKMTRPPFSVRYVQTLGISFEEITRGDATLLGDVVAAIEAGAFLGRGCDDCGIDFQRRLYDSFVLNESALVRLVHAIPDRVFHRVSRVSIGGTGLSDSTPRLLSTDAIVQHKFKKVEELWVNDFDMEISWPGWNSFGIELLKGAWPKLTSLGGLKELSLEEARVLCPDLLRAARNRRLKTHSLSDCSNCEMFGMTFNFDNPGYDDCPLCINGWSLSQAELDARAVAEEQSNRQM